MNLKQRTAKQDCQRWRAYDKMYEVKLSRSFQRGIYKNPMKIVVESTSLSTDIE